MHFLFVDLPVSSGHFLDPSWCIGYISCNFCQGEHTSKRSPPVWGRSLKDHFEYGERYGYIDICETGIYNVMCEGNIIPFNYVQASMTDSQILLLVINSDF